MATNTVSAVLFAKDLSKVASFYREVFGARVLRRDAEHEVLLCLGFQLVIHQIPNAIAQSIVLATPPERRERTAIRLNFPVDDIGKSRTEARRLGGQIDDRPSFWAGDDGSIFLGYDPEGNVIGVMSAGRSLERRQGASSDKSS